MILRKKTYRAFKRSRGVGTDLIALVCFCGLLVVAGCFHLRTTAMIPSNLRQIGVQTDNVFYEITANLLRRLHAAGVGTVTKSPRSLKLLLRNSHDNTDVPVIFDSLQGTVYSYSMTVQVQLACASGKVLRETTLKSSKDVLHNINQVSPPVLTPLMRRSLIQNLVDSLFNLVTSNAVAEEVKQQCQPSHLRK